jgi:hypothetical protein
LGIPKTCKAGILQGCVAAATAALGLLTSVQAQTGAALGVRLKARFEGDRTGACAVAALVGPTGVKRALACASTHKDGGPALDDAQEIGSIGKTTRALPVADLIAAGHWTIDDPTGKSRPHGKPGAQPG